MSVEIGKIVSGKVSGVTNFGAFIDLEDGKKGLVHISEISKDYVKDINDYVHEGQAVRVMIVSVDDNGKIALSLRKAAEKENAEKPAPKRPEVFVWSPKPSDEGLSFEDKMLKFKQISDEKMHDIKRNVESKRSGYRRGGGTY
ncbi:MAG: S1 RNA-binding domain-containing protein [Clostridia bacterium]|nr:S1 RNA-binding domain-containing protein [Clostridia bacterium]